MTDAIGIYTTYIALNALSPLDIPDEMRQRVEGSGFRREYSLCVYLLTLLWVYVLTAIMGAHIESFDNNCCCMNTNYIHFEANVNGTKNITVTAVNICPEDGIVDRSCFSEAQAFIYDIMRTRCVHDNHYVSTTETKATMQTI